MAVVGLVRQWADQAEFDTEEDSGSSAGLRTYALWSFLGSLAVYCSVEYSPLVYPIVLVMFGVYLTAGYILEHNGKGGIGLTSYAVGVITFLMGSLVMWGEPRVAIAIVAALSVLIAAKKSTHSLTGTYSNGRCAYCASISGCHRIDPADCAKPGIWAGCGTESIQDLVDGRVDIRAWIRWLSWDPFLGCQGGNSDDGCCWWFCFKYCHHACTFAKQ